MTIYFTEVPDRQIDPPERPEWTDEDEMAERQRIRESISYDDIREMVCDALSDELCDMIKRLWIQQTPGPSGHIAIGDVLGRRVLASAEDYIEHEIGQGKP